MRSICHNRQMQTLNKQMIETERLRLRRWANSDIEQIHLLLADPDVMQFSENGALSEYDQMTWLQRATTQQPKGALPDCLAIERKQDNRVIGYVSLTQDLARVQSGDVEIGFRLIKSVWGRGYATEATHRLICAIKLRGRFDRIVGIVDPTNRRSVRVLKKLGMTLTGGIMLDGYTYADHLYAMNARDICGLQKVTAST